MTMRVRLGINTCFAVKRWPRPADWAPIVAERLELRLVEHSFDLVDLKAGTAAEQARELAAAAGGLTVNSTFTGLAAYSSNLLLSPDPSTRATTKAWFHKAISFTESVGGAATGGHVGAFSVPDWRASLRREERWESLRADLGELAGDARAHGLTVTLTTR